MKLFNWSVFNHVTVRELTAVLCWIDRMPLRQIAKDGSFDEAPIQSNKLRFALELLEYFNLISQDHSHIDVLELGHAFVLADESSRHAFQRIKLMDLIPVSEIHHLLGRSVNGRLSRSVVVAFFNEACGARVSGPDIEGFLLWAVACRLFGFDRKRQEIVWIQHDMPPGSVQNGRASY
jgi:hypothetical protein